MAEYCTKPLFCKSNVGRRVFIQKASKELTGSNPDRSHSAAKKKPEANAADHLGSPRAKARCTSSVRQCKNRTADL